MFLESAKMSVFNFPPKYVFLTEVFTSFSFLLGHWNPFPDCCSPCLHTIDMDAWPLIKIGGKEFYSQILYRKRIWFPNIVTNI